MLNGKTFKNDSNHDQKWISELTNIHL